MQLNVLLLKIEKLSITVINNIMIILRDNSIKQNFVWNEILSMIAGVLIYKLCHTNSVTRRYLCYF